MQHEKQQYTKRENNFIIIITVIKCKAQEDRAMKEEDSDFSRCRRKSGGTVCDHSRGVREDAKKCLNQDTCASHAVKFITNSTSITEGREGGQQ